VALSHTREGTTVIRAEEPGTGPRGPGFASDAARNAAECLEIVPLGLSHRIYPDGRAVVVIHGELDAATADQAYDYVRQVIDRRARYISLDLAGLSFCDARGLRALVRIAACARAADRELRLVAPRPPLLKIMRITGVDANFPELREAATRPGMAGTGGSAVPHRPGRPAGAAGA
jgi:anti-sigma B factor antagonist